MIKAFEITKEELSNIECISPAGKDYNLHLNTNQHWELSESGKTLYLIDSNTDIPIAWFIVSKTIFVLKENEKKEGCNNE